MGHASAIALGLARSQPSRPVVCLDGDGAMLMHLGTIGTIATNMPANLTHVVLNNGCHESVGGLPSAGETLRLSDLLQAAGYPNVSCVDTQESLQSALTDIGVTKPRAIEVIVAADSRSDLGRPKRSPAEAKATFMEALDDSE